MNQPEKLYEYMRVFGDEVVIKSLFIYASYFLFKLIASCSGSVIKWHLDSDIKLSKSVIDKGFYFIYIYKLLLFQIKHVFPNFDI